jgi:hypothetical protein
MSALGQKQTLTLQSGMSALPPKADMCSALANVRFGPIADLDGSIDYLVGKLLNQQGHVDAEGLRRFLVDKELKFRWLLDRQIPWFRSLENLVHEARAAPVQLNNIRSIRDEPPELDKLSCVEHSRQLIDYRQLNDAPSLIKEHRAR